MTLNLKYCIAGLCFILGYFSGLPPLVAQTVPDLQEWATEVAEEYAADTEREELTFLIEDLLDLARDPININTANRQELERIFFLNGIQIENILYRRYVNGPFLTIYELQAVEGLPVETIRKMEFLIFFGAPEKEPGPPRLWGDLFARSGLILEKAAGYLGGEEEPAFRGDRFRHYLRAEVETNRHVSAGMIARKDPGEPMFGKGIGTVELVSGYVRYRRSEGWLREAVAGQYRMSAGQGLVVQSGMPARKSSMVSSVRNRGPGFRPSLSAGEGMALRGGYMMLTHRRWEVSPFFSWKKRSGRLQTDTLSNSRLTSIRDDGLYRTNTEIEQRNNLDEKVYGARAAFRGRQVSIEAGHLVYRLSRPLEPTPKPYNAFYFTGDGNENSWLAYTIMPRNLLFFGEVAVNQFRHPAFWNGLIWGVAPGFTFTLTHRSFPVQYRAALAAPLSESSSFSGEEGIYVGIQWQLPAGVALASYFDRYRFKWLKHRIDAPAEGFDWLTQLQYEPGDGSHLMLRFRHREKPANSTALLHERPIVSLVHDQLRGRFRRQVNGKWQFTTQAEWHRVTQEKENHRGRVLAQDVKLSLLEQKLTLTFRYALFDTDDYQARVYLYEPDVLYKFTVPAYSGRGARYLLLVNYKMKPDIHFWLRAAQWNYDDRQEIGTGNDLISGNTKTELRFQVRIKF